jgi:hypothetical protein
MQECGIAPRTVRLVGRPRKKLVELVRDRSFRLDRHERLIVLEPLPEISPEWCEQRRWTRLRQAQDRYVELDEALSPAHAQSKGDSELRVLGRRRRNAALSFSDAAREGERSP